MIGNWWIAIGEGVLVIAVLGCLGVWYLHGVEQHNDWLWFLGRRHDE
jgi:hypothetical protein